MAYPNIMVARYLKAVGQLTPEKKLKATMVLRKSYQRLLTFQHRGGGFSLYPGARPEVRLTGLGLQQLFEMSKVIHVDKAVIERAREWLIAQQNRRRNMEAFALYSLLTSGTPAKQLKARLDRLAAHAGGQPYVRALAYRALQRAGHPAAEALRKTLVSQVEAADDGKTFWTLSGGRTLMYGYGMSGQIELTALIVGGLLEARQSASVSRSSIDWLLSRRSYGGAWGSTQSTVLTLRVLLEAARQAAEFKTAATVDVALNGRKVRSLRLTPEARDLVKTIDLTDFARPGEHRLRLTTSAKDLPMTYALVWRAYVPWTAEGKGRRSKRIALDLRYSSTRVRPGEQVTATATVRYRGEARSSMVILDLGIPPGFMVEPWGLQALQRERRIDRFEINGRTLTLYTRGLEPQSQRSFSFTLRARYPVRAKAPASEVYEYYNPDVRDRIVPAVLTVTSRGR